MIIYTYNENAATIRTEGELWKHLTYHFDGSFDIEHTNPGGEKPTWSAGARIGYKIVDRVEVEGRNNFFSSSQGSSGGFERGTAGLALRFVW